MICDITKNDENAVTTGVSGLLKTVFTLYNSYNISTSTQPRHQIVSFFPLTL